MIARTLVPRDAKPRAAAGAQAPQRGSTYLDTRQVVPAELPVTPLDARTSIPAHVPLEVLAAKLVVPRDLPPVARAAPRAPAGRLPLTDLDDRVVIPRGAQPEKLEIRKPVVVPGASTVLEPDVLTTGVVNLLARPVEQAAGWNPGSGWMSTSGSILIHGLLVVLLLSWPTFFPPRVPTTEDIEMAHRMLGLVYVPPGQPAPIAPPQPAPQIRVDPRLFQDEAPPDVTVPKPLGPEGTAPQRELPDAPRLQPSAPQSEPARPAEPQRAPVFDSVKEPDPSKSPFALPKASAGKALEDSLRGAARERGGESGSFGGNLPSRPGGSSSTGGGGGGGQAFGTMELLTPTEGVDFSNYLNRVLARVRYQWYAVIPESARSLGQKGIVVLEFRIAKNGLVPAGEPNLVRTSGREELDFASMSSIRSSSPFEPLPAAFSGPYIALRFTYLYNIPPESYR